MWKKYNNALLLVVAWLLIAGIGSYLTFVKLPREIEHVERLEKLAHMRESEIGSLLAEYATTEQRAREVESRWRSRYRYIPAKLETPDVVARLNALTRQGFETFNVRLVGLTQEPKVTYYTFSIEGRGYFHHLYRFVWEIENTPELYRIQTLSLDHIDLVKADRQSGRQRMMVMVSFTMQLEAYYGGPPDLQVAHMADSLYRQLPRAVFPERNPPVNPFYPGILEQLPPNSDNLIDIEKARLVSIVGGRAVFQDETGLRSVGVGENVYLGQITAIDPIEGRVVARLNRGGILDEVELHLETGERYRQALGPVLLKPFHEE
ncbi:hypothetical protein HRbin18_02377 [bacterium HR18]|nr:hypothetical protein HRbin18_02377 [bacterium HR18]